MTDWIKQHFDGLLGLLFLAIIAWKILFELKKSGRRTAQADGTVIRVGFRKFKLGVNVPMPDIEFFDRVGNKHVCESQVGASWNPWPVGTKVKITYDPNDPGNSEVSFCEQVGVGMMFIVFAFGLFMLGSLIDTIIKAFLR